MLFALGMRAPEHRMPEAFVRLGTPRVEMEALLSPLFGISGVNWPNPF
jgi:hypothetical protein